jgi:glycosyltransferase involved in cell wall biosynthesis
MPPEVSIVIPSYDRLEYLRQAVDSVFTQTFRDWELIVADDGSGADAVAYLAELEKAPQVAVLRSVHTGNPSLVRNLALRQARGRFVAFLDSDDVWLPRKLELQVDLHRTCPERRWSYVAIQRINGDGSVMRGEALRPMPGGAIFKQLLALTASVSMSSVMAERTLLVEIGGFDEAQQYFEEFDLFLRLSLRSEVSVRTEPPVVGLRSHDRHYSANRIGVYESRAQLLDKMRPFAEQLGLGNVVQQERRRNSADLARVSAIGGRRGVALRLLWQSRAGAWHGGKWWGASAETAKSLLPSWTRAVFRRIRGRGP